MIKPSGFRPLGASALSSPFGSKIKLRATVLLLLLRARKTQVSPLENLEATASDLT
jgi:hypothetical protein